MEVPKRVLWVLDKNPEYIDSKRMGLTNFPMLMLEADMEFDGTEMMALLITANDPSDYTFLDQLAEELTDATDREFLLTYEQRETMETIKKILDLTFMMTIAIMMFLCFFSLSAAMGANLYD